MGDKVGPGFKEIKKETKEEGIKEKVKKDIENLINGKTSYYGEIAKKREDQNYEKEYKKQYNELEKEKRKKIDEKVKYETNKLKIFDEDIQKFINSMSLEQQIVGFEELMKKLNSNNYDLQTLINYVNFNFDKKTKTKFMEKLTEEIKEIYKNYNESMKDKKAQLDLTKDIFDESNIEKIKKFQEENALPASGYIDLQTIEKIKALKVAEVMKNYGYELVEMYGGFSGYQFGETKGQKHDLYLIFKHENGSEVLVKVNYVQYGKYDYSTEELKKNWKDKNERLRSLDIGLSDVLDTMFGGKGGRPAYFRSATYGKDETVILGIDARAGSYYWAESKKNKMKEIRGDPNFALVSITEKLLSYHKEPALYEFYAALMQQNKILEQAGIKVLGTIDNCTVIINGNNYRYSGGIYWLNGIGFRLSNLINKADENGVIKAYHYVEFLDRENKTLNSQEIPINTPTYIKINDQTYNIEFKPPKEKIDEATDLFLKTATLLQVKIGNQIYPISLQNPIIESLDERGNKIYIYVQLQSTGVQIGSEVGIKVNLSIVKEDPTGKVLDQQQYSIDPGKEESIILERKPIPIEVKIIPTASSNTTTYLNNINMRFDTVIQKHIDQKTKEDRYLVNMTYATQINGKSSLVTNYTWLATTPILFDSKVLHLTRSGEWKEIDESDYKNMTLEFEKRMRKDALTTIRGLGGMQAVSGLVNYISQGFIENFTLYFKDETPLLKYGIATAGDLHYKFGMITKGFETIIPGLKVTGVDAEIKEKLVEKYGERPWTRTEREKAVSLIGSMLGHYNIIMGTVNLEGLWKVTKKGVEEWSDYIDKYLTGGEEAYQWISANSSENGLTFNRIDYSYKELSGTGQAGGIEIKRNYWRSDIFYNWKVGEGKLQLGNILEKEEKDERWENATNINISDFIKKYYNPYLRLNVGSIALDLGYGDKKEENKSEYKYKNTIIKLEYKGINKIVENTWHSAVDFLNVKWLGIKDIKAVFDATKRTNRMDYFGSIQDPIYHETNFQNSAVLVQPVFQLRNGSKIGIGIKYQLTDEEIASSIDNIIRRKAKIWTLRIDANQENRFTAYFDLNYNTWNREEANQLIENYSNITFSAGANITTRNDMIINSNISYTNIPGYDYNRWNANIRVIKKF